MFFSPKQFFVVQAETVRKISKSFSAFSDAKLAEEKVSLGQANSFGFNKLTVVC
jgi:hypothetical protein